MTEDRILSFMDYYHSYFCPCQADGNVNFSSKDNIERLFFWSWKRFTSNLKAFLSLEKWFGESQVTAGAPNHFFQNWRSLLEEVKHLQDHKNKCSFPNSSVLLLDELYDR